jgi:membrane associated rhomboid family serine protease
MLYPLGDNIGKRSVPVLGITLIAINVFVFGYTTHLWSESFGRPGMRSMLTRQAVEASPWGQFMDRWGLVPARLAKGEWHGLVTYMFLHGNLAHIVGNMFVLWALVGSLENALRWPSFLGLYLLWGILAGLAHAAHDWTATNYMIGASGAIAGMMGAYCIVFGALSKIRFALFIGFHPIRFHVPAGLVFALWILTQLSGIDAQQKVGLKHGGIAYFAHLGGFCAGVVTMIPFRSRLSKQLELTSGGEVRFTAEVPPNQVLLIERSGPRGTLPAVPDVQCCPYCQSPLFADHCIAPNLARCPNPACRRLVPYT